MDIGRRVHIQSKAGVHYNPLRESKLYNPEYKLLHGPSDTPKDQPADSVVEDVDEVLEVETQDLKLACNITSLAKDCACARNQLDGMVTVSVNIAGMDVCAIVDSGAQISLLSLDVWQYMDSVSKEESKHSLERVVIKTLDESTVSTNGCALIDWSFSASEQRQSTTFALVEPDLLPACMLIGANIIGKLDLQIDYARNRVSIGDTELVPFVFGTARALHVQYCLTQEQLLLPQDSNDYIVLPGLQIKLTTVDLVEIQKSDKVMRKIVNLVRKRVNSKKWMDRRLHPYKCYANKLSLRDNVLSFSSSERDVVVLPKDFIVDLAMRTHATMSHPGKNKLFELLKKYCWHPSLGAIVSDVCYSCDLCQRNKISPQLVSPPITKLAMSRPFELIAADLVQLPRTRRGNLGCLVVVDHFTKWACVCQIKNKRGDTVADCLLYQILPSLPRVPERILTDNGPEFISAKFEQALQQYGISHSFSTPHKPASNGAVERLNRTLIEMIRCECSGSEEWDECLPRVVLSYNNSVHSSTGLTPGENILTRAHSLALVPEEREPEKKSNWKDGHPSFHSFMVGDWMLKKVFFQGNLSTNKLKPRYEGPYQIIKINNNGVSYVLKDGKDTEIRAHHSQLRRYVKTPDYLRREIASVDLPLKSPAQSVLSEVSDYSTDSDESSSDDSDEASGSGSLRSASHPASPVVSCNSIPKRDSTDVLMESARKCRDVVAPRRSILGIKTDGMNQVEHAVGSSGVLYNGTEICDRTDVSDAMLSEGSLASPNVRPANSAVVENVQICNSRSSTIEYRPIPLLADRSLILARYNEMYRLLSVTQEVLSDNSKALLNMSAQIRDEVDTVEEELSRSSLHLRLSPSKTTEEEQNSSSDAFHTVCSTPTDSSDSVSLLTLLDRLNKNLNPVNRFNASTDFEPIITAHPETVPTNISIQSDTPKSNPSSTQPSPQQSDDAQRGSALRKRINFEMVDVPQLEGLAEDLPISSVSGPRDVSETAIQRTSLHATPRYFTRSRGPVSPVPYIMAAPIERKKYTRTRRS